MNISTVHSNGPLSDGEPQARAPGVAGARFIHAIEAIEYFGRMFGSNTGAAINNI
jgi:hypothetical protein